MRYNLFEEADCSGSVAVPSKPQVRTELILNEERVATGGMMQQQASYVMTTNTPRSKSKQ